MVTKNTKVDRVEVEIDEIAQRILSEIEDAKSTNLSDISCAKKILYLSDIHYTKKICTK